MSHRGAPPVVSLGEGPPSFSVSRARLLYEESVCEDAAAPHPPSWRTAPQRRLRNQLRRLGRQGTHCPLPPLPGNPARRSPVLGDPPWTSTTDTANFLLWWGEWPGKGGAEKETSHGEDRALQCFAETRPRRPSKARGSRSMGVDQDPGQVTQPLREFLLRRPTHREEHLPRRHPGEPSQGSGVS
jgi:hypothetical protein